jgi:ABC-2 type transport system permease protein
MAENLRNIWAVASKELRSYFASPIAWVLLGLFACIFGFFFYAYLQFVLQRSMQAQFGGGPPSMNVNQDLIRPLLSNASVIVLFLMPMITMRTYAEERRSGTMELLLTSPLTDLQIVLGKFVGALGLYAAMLGVTLLYIATLFLYGDPEWRPLIAGYLGLLLLGGSFIAIGLFISSTTKNQMVAGTATFILLLLLWIINWLADSAGPTVGAILNDLSITQHFDDFGKGMIDTRHVAFYLCFIVYGLFLTLKSADAERWRG